MELYITPTSAYARMARIVVLEKGLADRVVLREARTREPDSPYYAINPSGRVPYLVRDDGVGMEESALICAYLDQLDGAPRFAVPSGPAGWELRRLEATARSLLDGLAVWTRELNHRPAHERSPTVLAHEAARSARLTAWWETQVTTPPLRGPLDMVQITLICALHLERLNPRFRWRAGCAALAAWADALAERPSIARTLPPRPADSGAPSPAGHPA